MTEPTVINKGDVVTVSGKWTGESIHVADAFPYVLDVDSIDVQPIGDESTAPLLKATVEVFYRAPDSLYGADESPAERAAMDEGNGISPSGLLDVAERVSVKKIRPAKAGEIDD